MTNNSNVEGFSTNELLPLILIGGVAYFLLKDGGLGVSVGQSTEQKAKEYEEKAKKYQQLSQTLSEISKREKELKELKQALKGT